MLTNYQNNFFLHLIDRLTLQIFYCKYFFSEIKLLAESEQDNKFIRTPNQNSCTNRETFQLTNFNSLLGYLESDIFQHSPSLEEVGAVTVLKGVSFNLVFAANSSRIKILIVR